MRAIEPIDALAVEAWERWPMKTAAGEAARRSHIRSQIDAETSYALLERYDPGASDALIDQFMLDNEPQG